MKLFGYLKQHLAQVLMIVLLLIAESWCELELPHYMSDIVNVGIQQMGIESPVAPSLRPQTLAALEAHMSQDEAQTLNSAYGNPRNTELMAALVTSGVQVPNLPAAQAQALAAIQLPETYEYTGSAEDAQKDSEFAALMQKAEVGLVNTMLERQGNTSSALQDSSYDAQKSVAFVRQELEAQGVDLNAIQQRYLWQMAAKMMGFALVSVVAALLVCYLASRVAATIARDLRKQVFSRVMKFSQAEVNTFSQASLITRCTNDVQQVQMTLVLMLRMVFLAPVMGAVALFRVLSTHTGLTWIIGASLLAILGTIVLLMVFTMPRFKRMQSIIDRVNLITREMLDGLMPIRAFGQQKHELARFDGASLELMKTQLFTNRSMMLMMPLMMFFMNVTSLAIVWFGAHGVDTGRIQVGDMMAFISYAMMIIMSFLILSMVAVVVPRAQVSAERINEVLATTSSVVSPEHPATIPAPTATNKTAGTLRFEHVSFSYPGAHGKVVNNVSFTAQPGQMVAIVGSTGSGKSSLIQLIPRLFDATEGTIYLDDVDIRALDLEDLRSRIGYVPQQGFLFSGTIASNLRFGAQQASDRDLYEALSVAQASDFVAEKPAGLDSEISQGGTNVSGGQRQRLAIARALALKPEVLVLDDSFSALDYATDKKLRHALASMEQAPTTIVVAQRIASVMAADQIIVLDDGEVVGQGTHQDLLASCPTYLEIATSQLSAAELGLDQEA